MMMLSQMQIDALINSEDYINKLAEELMLNEILCGECDPVVFLKRTMRSVLAEEKKPRSIMKSAYWDKWVERDLTPLIESE